MRPIILSLAFATFATMSSAQAIDTSGMDQAISMLQTTAQRVLDANNIDVDANTLSLNQLAQLKAAIDSTTPAEARRAIMSALSM